MATKNEIQPKKVAQSGKPQVKPVTKPKAAIKAKRSAKAEKSGKPNKIKQWWQETMGELRKVTWPTTKQAWALTKVVLIVMTVMSLFLGLMDFIFSELMALLVSL